ncbi:hypothetical protein [Caulobacter sp. NIBR1757]|uniref:hypothetical protein n=1 Tax=Caulobacter sp. NIBR1757 TaxID=3016000 RepID=UPI0022F0B70C|nr:hypothetical protein [Caulobacter sp. NIBR1757]WGM40934.1 hypothetical protein AMEJIAPC_03881 [Caulobacter sp. NIBR1757]
MKSRYAIAWACFVEDWLCVRLPFRDYEAALIDFAKANLDEENRLRLLADLANVKRHARSNSGRMVLLPPRRGTNPAGFEQIAGLEDNILVACRLRAPGCKPVKASLIAYEGRLHRMEFSPSPLPLWGEALTVEAAAKPGRTRLARRIDREEHG